VPLPLRIVRVTLTLIDDGHVSHGIRDGTRTGGLGAESGAIVANTMPHGHVIAIIASAITACNDQATRVVQADPAHAPKRYNTAQTAKTPVNAHGSAAPELVLNRSSREPVWFPGNTLHAHVSHEIGGMFHSLS
jgi:hypothetical protein